MSDRLRIRIAGMAGTSWLDKKDRMDHDMADSFDFHVHNSGLREAAVQELVSSNISYVHHLDRFVELRGGMDDHNNR